MRSRRCQHNRSAPQHLKPNLQRSSNQSKERTVPPALRSGPSTGSLVSIILRFGQRAKFSCAMVPPGRPRSPNTATARLCSARYPCTDGRGFSRADSFVTDPSACSGLVRLGRTPPTTHTHTYISTVSTLHGSIVNIGPLQTVWMQKTLASAFYTYTTASCTDLTTHLAAHCPDVSPAEARQIHHGKARPSSRTVTPQIRFRTASHACRTGGNAIGQGTLHGTPCGDRRQHVKRLASFLPTPGRTACRANG